MLENNDDICNQNGNIQTLLMNIAQNEKWTCPSNDGVKKSPQSKELSGVCITQKKTVCLVWRRSVTDIYNSGFFCLKSWKKSIPPANLKEPLGNGFAVTVYADFVKFIFKVSII